MPCYFSSVLLCQSVLNQPDTQLVQLCLNRLTWGGLDVAVLLDNSDVTSHAAVCAAGNQSAPVSPQYPPPQLTFQLPSPVQLLSTPSTSRSDARTMPRNNKTQGDLTEWLTARAPGSVVAVTGPSPANTAFQSALSAADKAALGAIWCVDAYAASCTAACPAGISAPMSATPHTAVSPVLPCLSYLPQRIAHFQYFQHLGACKQQQRQQQRQQQPDSPGATAHDGAQHSVPWETQGKEASLARLPPVVVVGYVMKASRELAMAKCTPHSNRSSSTMASSAAANPGCSSSGVHASSTNASIVTDPSISSRQHSMGGLLSLVPCSPSDWSTPENVAPSSSSPAPVCTGTAGSQFTDATSMCAATAKGSPACLVFAPLDLSRPLDEQMPFHAVLHKASDELEWVPKENGSSVPSFSKRMQGLRAWLSQHPEVSVFDPFESTGKVIDRLQLCSLTENLNTLDLKCISPPAEQRHPSNPGSSATRQQALKLRAASPKYCVVRTLDPHAVDRDLQAAGLIPPLILKPSVACGLPQSHGMALVVAAGGAAVVQALQAAAMPLPAIAQQFSNHGGQVAKVYAAGDKVFYAIRPSIPDLPELQRASSSRDQLCSTPDLFGLQGFHVFDSLNSLPTAWGKQQQQQQQLEVSNDGKGVLNLANLLPGNEDLLQAIAQQLRASFGLTFFGFDVILVPTLEPVAHRMEALPSKSVVHGYELVVIDVNYFPSYNSPAAAVHVWQAMLDQLVGRGGVLE